MDTKEKRVYKGVCWPLVIYIIITLIALIILLTVNTIDATTKSVIILLTIVWSAFWGFILWAICYYCHTIWAWIIMLIPFIINLLFLMAVMTTLGVFDTSSTFPGIVSIVD